MMARQRGFTLIEIMVAVAVFSVMSLLAWSTLNGAVKNSEILNDRMDRLQSIQRTMLYLSSDILQMAPRPIRDELGTGQRPALLSLATADFPIELTRGGWNNPVGLPRSTLQRTAYRIEDNELLRYHWRVLDRTFANEPITEVLIDDVESLTFRVYDATGHPTDTWPPIGVANADPRARPRAVEIILTLTNEGEIRRLIEVAP